MGCSQSSKYQIDSEENKIKNISTNLEKAAKNANQKQKDIVNELISNTTR